MICLTFWKDNITAAAAGIEGFDDSGYIVGSVVLAGIDCTSWAPIITRMGDPLRIGDGESSKDERED